MIQLLEMMMDFGGRDLSKIFFSGEGNNL